jgi:adenine-specific DNA glycosylase
LLCPIAKFCKARQFGLQKVIPEKRKKRATEEVTLAAAVLLDSQGRTLLLPPPHGNGKHATHETVVPLISKMWHFPTIVVEHDAAEELRAFLAKLFLSWGSDGTLRLERMAKARHAVTYRAITLLPYRGVLKKLPPVDGAKLISLSDLISPSTVAVSNLTRKIARAALAEPVAVSASR